MQSLARLVQTQVRSQIPLFLLHRYVSFLESVCPVDSLLERERETSSLSSALDVHSY